MYSRRKFLRSSLTALAAFSSWPAIVSAADGFQKEVKTDRDDSPNKCDLVIDIQTYGGPDFEVSQALDAGLTTLVVDIPAYPRTFENAIHSLAEWNYAIAKPDSKMQRVLTSGDLTLARNGKRLGVILSCQDGSILGASTVSVYDYNLQNLQLFYDLGMRILTLTHNERNALGDSFREPSNAGLSYLGKAVVESMNALGMVVDLSHCGDQTTIEAINLSQKPCMVTHAGCRAIYPSLRNKSDEQIRALANRGGLFGVFNMSNWLTKEDEASLATVLDHLEHAMKIGGIEHVAFGSDGPILQIDNLDAELEGIQEYTRKNLGMPGAETIPKHVRVRELNSPQRMMILADELKKRGYKSDSVDKIIGGNFRRVFEEVCG